MFEARLTEGIKFKQILDVLEYFVQDWNNLVCTKEKISMHNLDWSHISLAVVSLNAAAFEHFRCDRTLTLGLCKYNTTRVLEMMGKNDILTIKADEEEYLTLIFENPKAKTMKEHEVKTMNIDDDVPLRIPYSSYKASVTMNSSRFQQAIRDLEPFFDNDSYDTSTCTIAVTQEGIRFSDSGSSGTHNILIRENGAADDQVVVDMEEPVEQYFSLKYLKRFTKATSLAPQVILHLNPDMPMVVEYPMFEELGFLKFHLAPKIEEEEEDAV